MRIKLLQVPAYHTDPSDSSLFRVSYFPPLGLATLTGFLKEKDIYVKQDDLDVKTFYYNYLRDDVPEKIDLSLFNNEQRINNFIEKGEDEELENVGNKILKLTKTKNFDVIGLSLSSAFSNISSIGLALVIGKLLKQINDSLIILGGSSVRWSKIHPVLKTSFIDCGLECNSNTAIGELNLLNFCKQIEKGIKYYRIPGVVYLKSNKLIKNKMGYEKEEEYQFTRPCFDGLPINLYKHKLSCRIKGELHVKEILILPYRFVRGCPNACAFCCHSTNPNWSALEPGEVASDLEYFSKKYKTNFFFFLNTNINPTYQYANSFAKIIKEADVQVYWTDCANFAQMDKTLLQKLKEAGAIRLMFGLESVSNKILNYIGKNVNLEHASQMIREAYNLGIFVGIELICGFPYETDDDVIKTINFLRENKKYLKMYSLNKFYLDGRFLEDPKKYGIKLLKESQQINCNWTSKGFDELKGLRWEKKIKKINEAYDRILIEAKQIKRSSIYQIFFRASYPQIKCLNKVGGIKDHFYKKVKINS